MAVLQGLPNVVRPTEGVRHEQTETSLHVLSKNLGTGTLIISESVLTWIGEGDRGITLPYLNISLHAICRDSNVFPHECLYIHTDAEIPGLPHEPPGEDEEDEADNDSLPDVTELYFVPSDKESLKIMYDTLTACQSLHPDPADDYSPDEAFFDGGEGGIEEDDEEIDDDADFHMAELQISNNTNGHNDDDMFMDPECFEDAEEN